MLMTAKKGAPKGGAAMSVTEAMAALGVSKTKIAAMIRRGELHAVPDPLDRRHKRISRSEVEELLARTRAVRGEE